MDTNKQPQFTDDGYPALIGWESHYHLPFCIWCMQERDADRPIFDDGRPADRFVPETACTKCHRELGYIVKRERNLRRYKTVK